MSYREFIKALRDKDRERLKAVRQADKMKRMVDFICKVADDNEAQMDAEIEKLKARITELESELYDYREGENQINECEAEAEARRLQEHDRALDQELRDRASGDYWNF
jgi:DNA repair exonuclease SbcCD ATPase subunit